MVGLTGQDSPGGSDPSEPVPAPRSVPRRAVLRWGAASVTLAAVSLTGPSEQAIAAATLAPTAAGQQPVLIPGTRQSVQAPAELGAVITVASSPVTAVSVATFVYDPRVYELNEQALAIADGQPVRLGPTRTTTDSKTGLVTAEVSFLEPVASGSVTVIVGHQRPRTYPLDVIRDYRAPSAATRERSGRRTASRRFTQERSDPGSGQPWGLQAGAVWALTTWGDGLRSYAPAAASAASIGPGPAPAGYTVRALADPAVVREIRVRKATTSTGRNAAGQAHPLPAALGGPHVVGMEWVAARSLPAGEQVNLALEIVWADLSGPLPGIKHPLVEVAGPAGGRATQRTTYQESVVRDDSIYDEESRNRFG